MTTFLDLLAYPYRLAYEHQVGHAPVASGVALWFWVWVSATGLLGVGLFVVQGVVYGVCDGLRTVAWKLAVWASVGAPIESRRRYWRWQVRVDSWLRAVQLRTMFPGGDRPIRVRASRIGAMTVGGTFAALVIGVWQTIAELCVAAIALLLTPFGLYSVAATVWVIARARIVSAAIQVGTQFSDIQLLGFMFTIGAFLALNAVSWRRRGLSKWRSEHIAGGYGDLDRIKGLVADVRSLLDSAITEWHDNMSRSWRDAHLQGRRSCRRSVSALGRRPVWPTGFDSVYTACVEKLWETKKISGKTDGTSALWLVTPRSARLMTFSPEKLLSISMFSPATRDNIARVLDSAEALSRAYVLAVEAQLYQARASVRRKSAGEVETLLVDPCTAYLASLPTGLSLPDPAPRNDEERPEKVLERACGAAVTVVAEQLEVGLRQELTWSALTKSPADSETVGNGDAEYGPLDDAGYLRKPFDKAVGEAVPAAVSAATEQLRNTLTGAAFRSKYTRRRSSPLRGLFPSVSETPEDDARRVVDEVIAAAFEKAAAAAARSVHNALDELPETEGRAQRELYQKGLEREIHGGCRTEAELHHYLTIVDAHLFPRSRWGRLLAAFNR